MKYPIVATLITCFGIALLSFSQNSSADLPMEPIELHHKGKDRHYLIHVPRRKTKLARLPIVLILHGGGGTADMMPGASGMNELSDEYGFIAVYPEGVSETFGRKRFATWNAGTCCGKAYNENVDDVDYISKILDDLTTRYSVDLTRVYVTGISNGGAMAHRLACELSERITAIGTVAAPEFLDECNPLRAVPIVHFHGTADRCALYDPERISSGQSTVEPFCPLVNDQQLGGGCFQAFFTQYTGIPIKLKCFWSQSATGFVTDWAGRNGCSKVTDITYKKGAARCISNLSCREGVQVSLCSVKDMGHVWPGSGPSQICKQHPDRRACRISEDILGKNTEDIDASRHMIEFFSQFQLPRYLPKKKH